jgi:hypothetical protein
MYKWPDKDKDEVVDYSVDWSRFLGTDTIAGVTWFIYDAEGAKVEVDEADIVNGLQFVSSTSQATVATIRVGLGTNNIRYRITCHVDTLQGLTYERSIYLRIKEK